MHETALLLAVAVRTLLVLLACFGGLRLLGRRRSGEAQLEDIVLVLLMANAVQNAMTTGSGDLGIALVSSGTLLMAGWLFAKASAHSAAFERRVTGGPTLLVNDGAVLRGNLRREHVRLDEVKAAVRKQGLAGLSEVSLAVLEPNGSISVVGRRHTGTR